MSLLEVASLSKQFGGVTAVDACSLSLEQGSITGLIGPNGSGKTTVFNLITGFLPKDSGDVLFNGQSISNLGPDRVYALGIGRTFQLARIFPRLTALENMLVPMRRQGLRGLFSHGHRHDERTRAMDMLGAMDIAHVAGLLGGSLSYGQRKLLELAAVMMVQPQLVLLDEPAGGVNPALVERISEHIQHAQRAGCVVSPRRAQHAVRHGALQRRRRPASRIGTRHRDAGRDSRQCGRARSVPGLVDDCAPDTRPCHRRLRRW